MVDELSNPEFLIEVVDLSDFDDDDYAPFIIDVIDLSDFDEDLFDFGLDDPLDAFFDDLFGN